MDPTATLEEILCALSRAHQGVHHLDRTMMIENAREASQKLRDLADWLDMGGFPPVCIAEPRAQDSWLYRTWTGPK